jgi:hypothetical protein
VDACRGPSIREKEGSPDCARKIEVLLKPIPTEDENGLVPLELTVRDNGDGMSKDPEELVQLFASTKAQGCTPQTRDVPSSSSPQEQASASSGKFGVGLSASILHSHHIFGLDSHGEASTFFEGGGICQITSNGERCVLGVDRRLGRVVCVHRSLEHDEDGPGTEVRIIVPGGPVVGSAPERIRAYFQRLALTSHLLHCSIT